MKLTFQTINGCRLLSGVGGYAAQDLAPHIDSMLNIATCLPLAAEA
jgi:hypothetical protein